MDVCTIVAKNYLAFARVLARSHREHHPEGRCWVLVIDEVEGRIDPASEPFELLTPADLEIEPFERMAALYSILELSTAVKPWLLRHLMKRRGLDRIVYLDPDIRLFSDLSEVDRLLDENAMVVTPHLTDPMPRDGAKPSESDILIAGSFNLGFLGLRDGPAVDAVLDWWAERLETDCVVAPERGFFVDQRWIDFAPGLVESFHVLRDPAYNVAYWNLASRELTRSGDGYAVNGHPLRFFHFSGFDPLQRDRLSLHQDRIELRRGSALQQICHEYADALLAEDFEQVRSWPYTWNTLPGGIEVDKAMRQAYREGLLAGEVPERIFEEEGARAFVEWLNGPARRGGEAGVTRYLEAVWETREDLEREFPELDGTDAPRLLAWADVYGRHTIPPQLMPSALGVDEGPVLPGVNVAGFFRAVLGIGELGRQVIEALRAEGVRVAPVSLLSETTEIAEYEQHGPANSPFGINLIVVNADTIPHLARDIGPGFFADRHTIGLWAWEVDKFPEDQVGAFEYVDEVWVLSEHMVRALQPVAPVPVLAVPIPIELPEFKPRSRAELGLPEGFVFLFVFDYNSVFERKNPLAAIEAFARAFPDGGPSFVIKTVNHERFPEQHARLRERAAQVPGVSVMDRVLPPELKDALLASCDCYVSLHRAEGFGFTLAEAMCLGKPVIATGYSGNLDFMDETTGYLVRHQLVPIGEGNDPYPPDARWAEPDLEHAAQAMREVVERPDEARRRGERAAQSIRVTHSRAAAGRFMARRLVRIQDARGVRGTRRAKLVDTDRLARRIHEGPRKGRPVKRLAGLRKGVRKALLRVLQPYAVHQRMVDEDLLAAIGTLDTSMQAVAGTQARMDRLLAEERALPFSSSPVGVLQQHPVAGVVSGFSAADENGRGPDLYRRFEDIFRGSESLIRERQRPYLKLVGDREPVLDLGCGRGEFLDLLREAGLDHAGVDADPAMVEHCRARGHERVELGDAVEFLERQPDDSVGVVFSAQVIEHLPYEALLRIYELSHAKLRPGGLLVLETVNPHSVQALKTFWTDPTHLRPIFPETALALGRLTGFESGFVYHPNGVGNVELDRYREGEFALVATKGGGRPEGSGGDELSVPGAQVP